MDKRLKKFITSMKQRGIKYVCGDEQSVLITFVRLFGRNCFLEFVIRVTVDELKLHNIYAIDGFINKRHIDEIERKINESREESEEK